jgi:tetratricopeptide (TPR) repeat protein
MAGGTGFMAFAAARLTIAVSILALLTACKSDEERARAHFESGVSYAASGEDEKARVEFANAINIKNDFNEARLQLSAVYRRQGQFDTALGQYLRAIEFDPGLIEARAGAADLLLIGGAPADAMKHLDAALALVPGDANLRGMKAVALYRLDRKDDAVALARAVERDDPGQFNGSVVLASAAFESGDSAGALAIVDAALARSPDNMALHVIKVSILETIGNDEATLAELRAMRAQFPEDSAVSEALVAQLMLMGDIAGAEAELEETASRRPDDVDAAMKLVQFILDNKGPEPARARLEAMARADGALPAITRALASFDVGQGNRARAIEVLRQQIAALPEAEGIDESKVLLAAILADENEDAASDALVDEVLADDPANGDALKLRARRLISADRPEDAITDLRAVLDKDPRDTEAMLLEAEAHERNGNDALAQERLALAVKVSGGGVREALAYAEFLRKRDKGDLVADVLSDASDRNPGNRRLLMELARARLDIEDWVGAGEVAEQLRGYGDPEADRIAESVQAAVLIGRDEMDAAVEALRKVGTANGTLPMDFRTLAAMVEAMLSADGTGRAVTAIEDFLKDNPDHTDARLLLAQTLAQDGNHVSAIAMLRAMIAEKPDLDRAYLMLSALLRETGAHEEADATVDVGLEKTGFSTMLKFEKAVILERRGDMDGAIAIYEELYSAMPDSEVLANNLASLLAQSRNDANSLERAEVLARRLRGSPNPSFQDTYGWVLHRRGQSEAALPVLMQAVNGLPDEPLVRLHLGEVYVALGQTDLARTALNEAMALATAGDQPEIAARAATGIEALSAPPAAD